MIDFDHTWIQTLGHTIENGMAQIPRGQPTLDIIHRTTIHDMRYPVLRIPERKLSYQFMAAEAYWILSGDDCVDGIAPWNKNISQFSDDGERFFGAYGPKITDQLDYVVGAIARDQDTRQAALTIWRENPKPSKDLPCTIAMVFRTTPGMFVNSHVFMRSNDIWLGMPYDVFNFSMVTHDVCAHLNEKMDRSGSSAWMPGKLYLTAASSHLYQRNLEEATRLVEGYDAKIHPCLPTPPDMHVSPQDLMGILKELRDSKPGDPLRWWEAR